MNIPEFILRKLIVPESLQIDSEGFQFNLRNTYAPGTITSLAIEVDGKPIPAQQISLHAADDPPRFAVDISSENPFLLRVGVDVIVRIHGSAPGKGRIAFRVETREAGMLAFRVRLGETAHTTSAPSKPSWRKRRLFTAPMRAEAELDLTAEGAPVDRRIYGHFIEHLERCIYGGIWTEDGSKLRQDTLALIRALRPPVIRYPGGNFASGYHWEDGIGDPAQRPRRYDTAWQAWESNRVGTDEYMTLCRMVESEPFLVVNDGSGTAEEAARWVAYCNQPADDEMGARRAANGHPQPYHVRLWGVGNEVWGVWQIGHTTAENYAARLLKFIHTMRAVDPKLEIVAVGDAPLSDDPQDPATLWNRTVLDRAGEQIDYLSFHIYQPGETGWRESYDLEALHHSVCAAPLDVEAILQRMGAQIAQAGLSGKVRIALDEWNLWLTPPPEAETMHQLRYTMRDALYVAGMLNVFQRNAPLLGLANIAQLVNVLPLIVTDQHRAYPTPLYFPFLLYREMQDIAVPFTLDAPTFASLGLSPTLTAHQNVPYLDIGATRDTQGETLVLGLVNRHPWRPMHLRMGVRGGERLAPYQAQVLHAADPLASNDFDHPDRVRLRNFTIPALRGDTLHLHLPPASLSLITLRRFA